MTEELEQRLKNLKLRRMLSVYDEQLRAAEKAQVSYSEFVAGLLRAQWHDRQESALEWRIRRANLPERWSLETFPWSRQPGVSRKQMRAFAELDFVAKHENIVLVGKTGVGKTGLACGLLLKALQNGHRCQFVRAQDLFDDMYASLAASCADSLTRVLRACHRRGAGSRGGTGVFPPPAPPHRPTHGKPDSLTAETLLPVCTPRGVDDIACLNFNPGPRLRRG